MDLRPLSSLHQIHLRRAQLMLQPHFQCAHNSTPYSLDAFAIINKTLRQSQRECVDRKFLLTQVVYIYLIPK